MFRGIGRASSSSQPAYRVEEAPQRGRGASLSPAAQQEARKALLGSPKNRNLVGAPEDEDYSHEPGLYGGFGTTSGGRRNKNSISFAPTTSFAGGGGATSTSFTAVGDDSGPPSVALVLWTKIRPVVIVILLFICGLLIGAIFRLEPTDTFQHAMFKGLDAYAVCPDNHVM